MQTGKIQKTRFLASITLSIERDIIQQIGDCVGTLCQKYIPEYEVQVLAYVVGL